LEEWEVAICDGQFILPVNGSWKNEIIMIIHDLTISLPQDGKRKRIMRTSSSLGTGFDAQVWKRHGHGVFPSFRNNQPPSNRSHWSPRPSQRPRKRRARVLHLGCCSSQCNSRPCGTKAAGWLKP
jgi:hypothetical protein